VDKEQLHDGNCKCGKLKFASVKRAQEYNKSRHRRIYFCPISSTYHATSEVDKQWNSRKPPPAVAHFSIKKLQRELNEMATVKQLVIAAMEAKYKRTGEYKNTTPELRDVVFRERPNLTKTAVATAVFELKKLGTIVDLEERAPGGNGKGTYFALATHLEEVTKPTKSEKEEPKPVIKQTEEKKPAPIPSQLPVNQFDKINSQLGEILSKLNGLVNGYAQLVERSEILKSVVDNQSQNVIEKLGSLFSAVAAIKESELAIGDKYAKLIASKFTGEATAIATAVNHRLQDQTKHDSFIYRVREEVIEQRGSLEVALNRKFETLKAPDNFGTLSDEEKYRLGMRDGIRLAVEMGLILPDN
jgi:hypothetical protein